MKQLKTEDKIISAAMKEFAQHGMDGARIDRIAKNSGANKAMIYYYFKNKESLYETILNTMYSGFFKEIANNIPKETSPADQLFAIVTTFITYINGIDKNFIRIMLREIASGGKYFKKLALPNLIIPIFTMINTIIDEGKKEKLLKDVHNRYTYLMVVGSVVLYNAMKLTLEDTEFGKTFFPATANDEFMNNLLTVFRFGVLK